KLAVARLQPRIGNGLEAEALPPVVHRLLGVAHPEVQVVDGLDLEEVRFLRHGPPGHNRFYRHDMFPLVACPQRGGCGWQGGAPAGPNPQPYMTDSIVINAPHPGGCPTALDLNNPPPCRRRASIARLRAIVPFGGRAALSPARAASVS